MSVFAPGKIRMRCPVVKSIPTFKTNRDKTYSFQQMEDKGWFPMSKLVLVQSKKQELGVGGTSLSFLEGTLFGMDLKGNQNNNFQGPIVRQNQKCACGPWAILNHTWS